jgi:hypothetical protein
MNAKLLYWNGRGQWVEYPLRAQGTIIGREPSCTIPISDISMSQWHARISGSAAGWFIEDMTSTNGTFVNGRRVQGQTALPHLAQLQCGSAQFRFAVVGDDQGTTLMGQPEGPQEVRRERDALRVELDETRRRMQEDLDALATARDGLIKEVLDAKQQKAEALRLSAAEQQALREDLRRAQHLCRTAEQEAAELRREREQIGAEYNGLKDRFVLLVAEAHESHEQAEARRREIDRLKGEAQTNLIESESRQRLIEESRKELEAEQKARSAEKEQLRLLVEEAEKVRKRQDAAYQELLRQKSDWSRERIDLDRQVRDLKQDIAEHDLRARTAGQKGEKLGEQLAALTAERDDLHRRHEDKVLQILGTRAESAKLRAELDRQRELAERQGNLLQKEIKRLQQLVEARQLSAAAAGNSGPVDSPAKTPTDDKLAVVSATIGDVYRGADQTLAAMRDGLFTALETCTRSASPTEGGTGAELRALLEKILGWAEQARTRIGGLEHLLEH